ncbi:MAG: hypothetical protein EXR75_09600 [Myxococcales bacterium]|nr:hypothetical protein [Myxococcales bacterium]
MFWPHSVARPLVGLCVASALVAVSFECAAAIAVTKRPDNSTGLPTLTVSRSACQNQTVLSYTLGTFTGSALSVWATANASADCRLVMNRTGAAPTCFQLGADVSLVSLTSVTLALNARLLADIVPGIASCVDTSTTDQPKPVTVYFLVDATTGDAADATTEPIDIDVLGPPAPTDVLASVNDDTSLKVTFTPPKSNDLAKYQVYCDATATALTSGATTGATTTSVSASAATSGAGGAEGSGTASSTGGAGGTSSTGGGASSTGGAGGASSDVGGASSTGGAGGTTSAGGAGGTSSTGGATGGASSSASAGASAECTSQLVAGELPNGLTSCGEAVIPSTQVVATGFIVHQLGAVAVAAIDLAGNVGVLSAVDCATPEPVEDFFDAYRKAGGQAGNGCGCSVGRERERGLGGASLALAWLGVLVLRRRRNANMREEHTR